MLSKEPQKAKGTALSKETQKVKDTVLAVRFTEWYCKAYHQEGDRRLLESPGTQAGIYGKRPPLLCADCAAYARYVELRTELCPNTPKPFCTACTIKCYAPPMAEYSRKVMRYAGPRSLFSRYWRRALQHILLDKRKQH